MTFRKPPCELKKIVFQQQQNLGRSFSASKMHLRPPPGGGSVVAHLLFNILPIVCGSSVFVFVLLRITLCPF